jgi:hypothetical protein
VLRFCPDSEVCSQRQFWLVRSNCRVNRPGVRALVSPPKTLTVKWEETYSLDGFPVSKFLRILPPIPAPPKRNAETQTLNAPSGQPLAASIEFGPPTSFTSNPDNPRQPADTASDSQGVQPENTDGISAIRQTPEPGSEEAQPAARTKSVGIRFSEPRDQDGKLAGEKQERGQGADNSPGDKDLASETEEGGNAPKRSNVSKGAKRQTSEERRNEGARKVNSLTTRLRAFLTTNHYPLTTAFLPHPPYNQTPPPIHSDPTPPCLRHPPPHACL